MPGVYSAGLCRSSMVLAVTDAGACSAVSVTDAACSAVSVTDAAEPSPAPSTLPNLLRLLLSRLAVPAARASGSAAYPCFEEQVGLVMMVFFICGYPPPSLLISVVDPRRKHEDGRGNSRSLPCPKPGVAPSMLPLNSSCGNDLAKSIIFEQSRVELLSEITTIRKFVSVNRGLKPISGLETTQNRRRTLQYPTSRDTPSRPLKFESRYFKGLISVPKIAKFKSVDSEPIKRFH